MTAGIVAVAAALAPPVALTRFDVANYLDTLLIVYVVLIFAQPIQS